MEPTRVLLLILVLSSGVAQQLTRSEPPADTNYVLGPNDVVVVNVLHLEEITSKSVPIDQAGNVDIPLAGSIHTSGTTVQQLTNEIKTRLQKYLRDPQVTITIAEYHSQPVSVLGAVNKPGVQQLEGHRTLFEVLSTAGGLRNDAGSTVTITRLLVWGPVPLPTVHVDVENGNSVAQVNVDSIMFARHPEENIRIMPNDVITVPVAQVIYVLGCVKRAGGYSLGEVPTISALAALAKAEGMDRAAAPQRSKILRPMRAGERIEIAVDLKRILEGKANDVALHPNDILFIPVSHSKAAALRVAEAALQIGTGAVIYR